MENVIKICMGSSCFSRGNRENLGIIKQYINDNDLDAKIILIGNLCEGRCNLGPNLFLNGTLFSNIRPENIENFLKCLD